MATVRIFDPALCCSTGVCGVDVDQALVTFAADVDWLKAQGVVVERVNLAHEPQAFLANPTIRRLVQAQGNGALPAILVEGVLKQSGTYPTREDLTRWIGEIGVPDAAPR